ncbi:MAG: hypothetical protein ACOX9R_04675 [Armatimonadota bacterium]
MPTIPSNRAVVTDAGERVALHVIRALGRAGIDVVATEVAERCSHCPGLASRYAVGARALAAWDDTDSEWSAALLEVGREGDVLMPACFNSLLRVIRNEDALQTVFRTLLPPEDSLLKANDKWSLHEFSRTQEVRTPKTWRPEDVAELERIVESVELPIIVKLRHDMGLCLEPGQRYAMPTSPGGLWDTWQRFDDLQSQPLVQQFIPGESYGFEALYDRDHRCVASFQHRRLVECPPEGGPSAVCESVRVPELEEYGRRLLDELKWTGVARWSSAAAARRASSICWRLTPVSGVL